MKDLRTHGDLRAFLRESDNTMAVVEFYATWCGPCNMMAPFMEEMEAKHPEIRFAKIDVDDNQESAESYDISAMPTVLFFIGGTKVAEVIGYDRKRITELLGRK